MKCLASFALAAARVLAATGSRNAQDCGSMTNWDLHGTYTMTGHGWIDLSKLVATLPAGSIPMTWVGALSYNGTGGGSGWVSVNAGGVQMNAQFVNLSYQMNGDCSVSVNYSMKVKELGLTLGPAARLLIVSGTPGALELQGISVGYGPGTLVDVLTMRRVSMQFK